LSNQQATLDKDSGLSIVIRIWSDAMAIDNPNRKGTLGEIAVCKELLQQNF